MKYIALITVKGLAAHRGPTSSLSAPSAAGLSRTAPCSAIVASGCASNLASTELNSALFALTAAAASGLFVEVVPLSSGGSRVAKQGSGRLAALSTALAGTQMQLD
jgi:hypothetical protein